MSACRASHALLSIEVWLVIRTRFAFAMKRVVCLMWRTAHAFPGFILKVFWWFTFNTKTAIPKLVLWAGTRMPLWCLARRTIFALFVLLVVVHVVGASYTLFSVENWCRVRALCAMLYIRVIELICWAAHALELPQIKVFWQVTLNALLAIPKSASWARTRPIYNYFSSFTFSAFFSVFIVVLVLRAGCALFSIKNRSCFGAVHTSPILDIINFVSLAG